MTIVVGHIASACTERTAELNSATMQFGKIKAANHKILLLFNCTIILGKVNKEDVLFSHKHYRHLQPQLQLLSASCSTVENMICEIISSNIKPDVTLP